MDSVFQGHIQGFDRLTQILSWCKDLGINEVTVYAFSIENFKRSQQEVDDLLSLATEKFQELLQDKEKLREHGVKIRIWGELNMLPIKLQKLLAETVLFTASHDKAYLNVCFAYTSRAEITDGINQLVESAIPYHLVNEEALEKSFWSYESPFPDLLVRTSGEIRLSDFLIWQSGYSVLAFVPKLWPEFSIWDLLKAVFYYQRYEAVVQEARRKHFTSLIMEEEKEQLTNEQQKERESFLRSIHTKRLEFLHRLYPENSL